MGDGRLRPKVEAELNAVSSLSCRFWGNMPPERMPEIFNCTDVLVLPSRNEGLPLVLVEASRCGADIVASRVGGVPEVMDGDFTVALDGKDFAARMAERVVACLEGARQSFDLTRFDWRKTALEEKAVIERIAVDC